MINYGRDCVQNFWKIPIWIKIWKLLKELREKREKKIQFSIFFVTKNIFLTFTKKFSELEKSGGREKYEKNKFINKRLIRVVAK